MITGRGIVVLAGILFLLTGIVNLVVYVTRKDSDGQPANSGFSRFFGWLVSLAAIILGLCMLVFTETFNQMIPFIFGLLIFFSALILVFLYLFRTRKIIKVPGWSWLFPLIITILGVITFTQKPDASDPLIMILTGVSMIIFGLAGIILVSLVSGARRQALADQKLNEQNTIDTHAKEISSSND